MAIKIAEMSETVKKIFTEDAEQTARRTTFVQRASKMTGSLWLQLWVLGLLDTPQSALSHLAEWCEEQFGLHITAQGIDDRVQTAAVTFFKAMFGLALSVFRQTVRIPIRILTQFTAVNIFESTGISLPACLAEEFPGSGGDASPAALKLQLVVDFLTGAFKAIDMTDGIHPDQRYARFLDAVEAGSLNLFDPGYFTLKRLKGIIEKGGPSLCVGGCMEPGSTMRTETKSPCSGSCEAKSGTPSNAGCRWALTRDGGSVCVVFGSRRRSPTVVAGTHEKRRPKKASIPPKNPSN